LIVLSAALKEAVARMVIEMLRGRETGPKALADFPSTRVSFSKPNDGIVFKVLKHEDLPNIGLEEGQIIYVYQEG